MTSKKINWETIVLLWLAFFFNQADRQTFNVTLPWVKLDLGLTDVQLGLISSVFILAICLFFPIADYIGDRCSKKRVIILSILIWSTATFCIGFSSVFVVLIIFGSRGQRYENIDELLKNLELTGKVHFKIQGRRNIDMSK